MPFGLVDAAIINGFRLTDNAINRAGELHFARDDVAGIFPEFAGEEVVKGGVSGWFGLLGLIHIDIKLLAKPADM